MDTSSSRRGEPVRRQKKRSRRGPGSMTLGAAGLSLFFLFIQLTFGPKPTQHFDDITAIDAPILPSQAKQSEEVISSTASKFLFTASTFPVGKATPLAAEPVDDTAKIDDARDRLGKLGIGDPLHLGGFVTYDSTGVAPRVWKYMIQVIGVKSVLDVGCGRGWTTSWFRYHATTADCVEGSPAALQQSVLKDSLPIEHDFTRGPWWPDRTYDAVWANEFVQQVSLHHMNNYLAAFSKAALLFVTVPRFGGWHHVEVHGEKWWRQRLELNGFVYHEGLTKKARTLATDEPGDGPDGNPLDAELVRESMLVFTNPRVTGLAEHGHLFPEQGCFQEKTANGQLKLRECDTAGGKGLEMPLDPAFVPTKLTSSMDRDWDKMARKLLGTRGEQVEEKTPERPEVKDLPRGPEVHVSEHAVFKVRAEVDRGNITGLPKIPVVVWPYFEFGVGNAESRHVEENGLNESSFLELSTDVDNFDPNVVWVGDTGYAYGWNIWCGKFREHVLAAKEKRAKLGLPQSWPIYIVDFTDEVGYQKCPDIEEDIGKEFVKYSQRALVRGRKWSDAHDWVTPGRVMPLDYRNRTYRHMPLVVRTDTIEALDAVLRDKGIGSLSAPLEILDRTIDVSHFWPLDGSGVGLVGSRLRMKVSETVEDMRKKMGLKVFVGLAGSAVRTGRRSVASDYIEAMLRTKIIVVTQRDGWEDHYRLFESLISGAMVMTDQMFSLPRYLENGTSVVEFSSEQDLRFKIMYYLGAKDERLSIARKGRRIAMEKHRSWHRIEEVIFGDVLTRCTKESGADCPYYVHAREFAR